MKSLQQHIKESFSEKDLVKFGNFLLSDERNKMISSKESAKNVHDADLANWKHTNENVNNKEFNLLVDWFKLDDSSHANEFNQLEEWYGSDLGNVLQPILGKEFSNKTSDDIWNDQTLRKKVQKYLKDNEADREKKKAKIQQELSKTWPSLKEIKPDKNSPGAIIRGIKLNSTKKGYTLFTTDMDYYSYDKLDPKTVENYKEFLKVRKEAYKEWINKYKGVIDL
jgi:hypothetical protein